MHRLTRAALRYPLLAVLVLASITVLLATGLPRLRTELGYRPLIGEGHPAIRRLESFVERFGGGFPVQVAWACGPGLPCEDVLDPTSLEMAHWLGTMLSATPGVRGIEGPATSSLLVPTPGGFAVRRLVERGSVAPDLPALADRAADDPHWSGRLVSRDRRAGMIVVQLSDSSSATSTAVVEALMEALEPFEARGFEFHLAGHAIEFVVAGRELAESSARLVPTTAAVVFGILLLLGRSWLGAVYAMATMGVALLWTLGLQGLLGWPQDSILQTLPPLILVVGVCDAVHLTGSVRRRLPGQELSVRERARAIVAAAREVGPACLVTTTTTAVALASFASSDLQTFARFGPVAAAGVAFCLLLSFTMLPMLLAVRAPAACTSGGALDEAVRAVAELARRRRAVILGVATTAALVCAVAWVTQLRVDTDGYEMYGERSRIIRWVRFIEDRFQRADALELEIELPDGVALEHPTTLASIAALSDWLGETVGPAHSVLDLLARLHRVLRSDDPAFERPAESAEANAQLLALMSFEHRGLLDRWLSLDRRRLRISVEAPFLSYAERKAVLAQLEASAAALLPAGSVLVATGPFAVGVDWVDAVQSTQLRSFASALALVFVLVAWHLRSWRLALLAMVPSVFPVVLTLGCMGILGLRLDVGRAMIAAVILGIAVDDAVHLLGQLRCRRAAGEELSVALTGALAQTGPALITTSLALATGFLTLLASPWQTISSFGLFVALAILVALAATLFVLPALLHARSDLARLAPAVARARWVPIAMTLPVLVALALAASERMQSASAFELPCWVLPNGRVLAGAEACGVAPRSQLRTVQAAGVTLTPETLSALPALALRSAGRVTLQVASPASASVELELVPRSSRQRNTRLLAAAGLSAALLAVPVMLAWRSSSPAALPFGFFYSMAAVVGVTALCGRGSPGLQRLAVASLCFAPALLLHLGLTFPRERAVVSAHRELPWVPYLSGVLLLPVAWVGFERSALLMPAAVLLMAFSSAGAWLILVATCGFTLRESDSLLQRARARLFWYGCLIAPAVPAVLGARAAGFGSPAVVFGFALLAVLLPLPIGLSISRYNVFDLGHDLRRGLVRLAQLGCSAVLLTGLLALLGRLTETAPATDPLRSFAVALVGLVVTDPVVRRVGSRLSDVLASRARIRAALFTRYSRELAELRTPDDVAARLGQLLGDGLEPRFVGVFVRLGSRYRLAHREGPFPDLPDALWTGGGRSRAAAARVMLPLQEAGEGALAGKGVGLVLAVERGEDRLGLVVLGVARGGGAYASRDVEFALAASAQAALALHNAALAQDLVARERDATTGRVALALAHDLGKQLDWTRLLAERLPERLEDPVRANRDLASLVELATEMSGAVRGFVGDVTAARQPGTIEVDHLVGRVVAAIGRRHPDAAISRSVDPAARRTRVPDPAEWVLANLLENAVFAEPEGGAVHVFATRDGPRVRLRVSDHGCGPPCDGAPSWFELGFTTRSKQGGRGLGLPVCRDIAEGLGGSLVLESGPQGGTTAVLMVPVEP